MLCIEAPRSETLVYIALFAGPDGGSRHKLFANTNTALSVAQAQRYTYTISYSKVTKR